jgi:CheY-like chemotaxis protein
LDLVVKNGSKARSSVSLSNDKGPRRGMAMVYAFSKRYGGHIKLYSEPDVGTTLHLFLPRSKSPASGAADEVEHEAELPAGNETILIVDDEKDLLQLTGQILNRLGYRTRLAENAAQALDTLKDNDEIDLLFSDVVMPGGMNGYELAKQATAIKPDLKVLLTSGFTSKAITHDGLARFSRHMLSKPYRKSDLARRIRMVLDA